MYISYSYHSINHLRYELEKIFLHDTLPLKPVKKLNLSTYVHVTMHSLVMSLFSCDCIKTEIARLIKLSAVF